MEFNINQLLGLGQLVALVGGGLLMMFKLGQKFDRLMVSLEKIDKVLEDHERRLTLLEGGRNHAA